MKYEVQDGFGSFTVNTDVDPYIEPNKQVLVVIGGVVFTSSPVEPEEAKHLVQSVKQAAPNTAPMIVVAN